jgi:hypothetical protein
MLTFMELLPRVRLAAVPDDGVLVVRGDEMNAVLLTEDATRFNERFSDWGRYGISAFYASGEDEVDALCSSRLVRFADIVVFRRNDLERHGVDVVPTFRTPHVTLCHDDVAELVHRLLDCEFSERPNPYYSPEEGGAT